jgi:hypothetical protein
MMELDAATLDDARDAWRAGDRRDLDEAVFSTATLGACLEAACWAAATNDKELHLLLDRWATLFPPISAALLALTTDMVLPRASDHDAPAFELRRCPSRAELVDAGVGVEWRYFLDRFRRSLGSRLGVSASRAHGLAASLHEMVDNVVDHAGLGDAPTGVVAYEVSDGRFAFAVADLGRGVLASLHENPANSGLSTHSDALLGAVTRGASRRLGVGGKGFADLLRALADLDGHLSFRTGSARLFLDGRGVGNRKFIPSNSPDMKGFQLSVVGRPGKSSW